MFQTRRAFDASVVVFVSLFCNSLSSAQPVAVLRNPPANFLVVPGHGPTGRERFDIRGETSGTGYRVDLLRHISCRSDRCTPYSPSGEFLWTLLSGVPPSIPFPTALLGRVERDGVFSPANVQTPNVPGTSGWDEGEYTVKLTVSKPNFPDAVSTRRFYVERSYDAGFNQDPGTGLGGPVLLNDMVLRGPLLADLNGDNNPEIIVGAAFSGHGRIYVFDIAGNVIFGSAQLGGSVLGTPAVGDVDGDGRPEIVATVDASGTDTFIVYDLPVTLSSAAPCFDLSSPPCPEAFPTVSVQIGAIHASPVVGRAFVVDPRDQIFMTTIDGYLHWFNGSGDQVASAARLAGACPPGTENFCDSGGLMESKPFLATLADTTRRVYVSSQRFFTTFAFDLRSGGALQMAPQFPLNSSSCNGNWLAPRIPGC